MSDFNLNQFLFGNNDDNEKTHIFIEEQEYNNILDVIAVVQPDLYRYIGVGVYYTIENTIKGLKDQLDEIKFKMELRIKENDYGTLLLLLDKADALNEKIRELELNQENLYNELKEVKWLE
ncbi:hypothetical protein ACLM5H_05145 [Fredinandcohnia humi]